MRFVSHGLRAELEQRFQATVAARPPARGPVAPWPLHLSSPVRETLVGAALCQGGVLSPGLLEYYAAQMPGLLLDQLHGLAGHLGEMLFRPLELSRMPRLRRALGGVFAALAGAGLSAPDLLGAPSPHDLLARRPSIAALYAPTLHGSGFPLLGASPTEVAVLLDDIRAGASAEQALDHRLSGLLIHELCHGPCPGAAVQSADSRAGPWIGPAPWLIIEAAVLHLGCVARLAHIFPQDPGEAVPGVSLFVLLGQGLARLLGAGLLWRLLPATPLAAVLPGRVAAALQMAGWQELRQRPHGPFITDALDVMAWLKLADAARSGEVLADALDRAEATAGQPGSEDEVPDLLASAAHEPWQRLPWFAEPPTPADLEMVQWGVTALFQVNVLAPTYQTHPAELPDGRLWVDIESCVVTCARRPRGVFGEPARWLFPPPLAGRLSRRGARLVRVEGAVRRERAAVAGALWDLALGSAPLPAEVVLRWTSSPG